MDHPTTEVSTALKDAIDRLLLLDEDIIETGKRVFSEVALLPDLFVITVLNRSLQLLHGFAVLTRGRNYLSATPLFRLQLDNALRLWAASLVESFDSFTSAVLDGKRIDKMKSKDGARLTDRYLVSTLSEFLALPKLMTSYDYASGFVHLSGQHVLATNRVEHGHRMSGRIGRWDDTTPDTKWLDLIEGFSSATGIVMNLAGRWATQKSVERRRGE